MEKSKTLISDFTEGSVFRKLSVFALPLFLSNLLQIIYNIADMIIVGMAAGKTGLSAVSIGGDVSGFLTFVAIGFSSASQVIIAQYVGAKQKEKIGRFIGTMFTFLLGLAIVLGCGCLFIREPILRWMNTPEEAWDQTLSYSTVCMAGMVFIYGYNAISAILRGLGDSKHPFWFISIAAVLNVGLDLLFVLTLDLGAFGAALATVISQGISFLLCIGFLWKNLDSLGFVIETRDFMHIDFDMLGSLLKLGIPIVIKSASVHFTKLFVNSFINSYGIVVSAVSGIANKFNSIASLASNSMNHAGATMVGQNIGAGKYKRVPKIMGYVVMYTLAFACCLSLALILFPEAVFGIFTKEADVLAVCMEYLPIALLYFLASAVRAPMNALINGSGNYKINFFVAILDGWILRIGLTLLLGLGVGMGYTGFWLGDAIAGFTPLLIGLFFYFSGRWKTNKYLIKK